MVSSDLPTIKEIEYIDKDALMASLCNDVQLVDRLLGKFVKDYEQKGRELASLDVESKEFSIIMHTLKGVSGTLFMQNLHKNAKAIYESASVEFKKEHIGGFVEELFDTIEYVKTIMVTKEPDDKNVNVDAVALKEEMDSMLKSIDAGDYIDSDAFELFCTHLASLVDDAKIQEIRERFSSFDYGGVKERLLEIEF